MAKAIDVARYLIVLRDADEKAGTYYTLSNVKLQKLLYFCQGGHYKWDGEKLITDKLFESWTYGAVIPFIYKKFKKHGQNDVYLDVEEKTYTTPLAKEEQETIEAVWIELRNLSVFTLINSMLKDEAHEASRNLQSFFITEENIKRCFTEAH